VEDKRRFLEILKSEEPKVPTYHFRAWILGENNVGKTQLLKSFGCEGDSLYFRKDNHFLVEKKLTCNFQFLEIPAKGLPMGSQLNQRVYRPNAAIIVFDATIRETFNKSNELINQIRSGSYPEFAKNTNVYLIGCKYDAVDEVEVGSRELSRFAAEEQVFCRYLNAKNSEEVSACFKAMVETHLDYEVKLEEQKENKPDTAATNTSRCLVS
jgi:hypothetical protein